ncbi:MAG: hypothetical protein IJX34_01420 [Clostridia bacterium]|nr:hypothetical protein [Clostridia bacterium]
MKKNKKFIIGSFIAVVLIILISTIVFALFTSRQEETAKINIGNLDVILVEDWPDDVPEIGIERNSKTVKGESVAEKKAYVRMRFIPVVEYYYEAEEDGNQIAEWRTAPISQNYIKLTIDEKDNWVKQGEYYYYKRILNSKESTTDIDLSWEIVEIPGEIKDYKIRTDVRVLLEYSQVSNEVWKTIFQIEDLPEGVER